VSTAAVVVDVCVMMTPFTGYWLTRYLPHCLARW
jgi:hypothetical protein